jgi:carbamoyltransferase
LVSNQYSVGHEFELLCESYGWHYLDGGKIMGLAQYRDFIDLLPQKYKNNIWIKRVHECANIQKYTQEKVFYMIKEYSKKYNINNIVLTGGYGLNCVANNYIIENLPNINFYADPVCFDAGISIGAAFYQYFIHTNEMPKKIENVYIGNLEKIYDIRNLNVFECSPKDVAKIVADGNIVAIFHGHAEAGQRALGNRSILFDPRQIDGRDKVNMVKNRELFRPFAGSILEEEASKYFEMHNQINSPYMMFAFKTKNNFWEKIPAIVHVDKTCRIQTVNKKQNTVFYNIILEFYKKTGIPIIGNTSFNLAGEPLVDTLDDAIKTLKNSKINYLYLPDIDKLIIKEQSNDS